MKIVSDSNERLLGTPINITGPITSFVRLGFPLPYVRPSLDYS